MLEACALHLTVQRPNGTELAALVHRGGRVAAAQQQLRDFLAALLAEAAEAGGRRDDVAPGELAGYGLRALTAAGALPPGAAVRRLVALTMAGLRPRCPGLVWRDRVP